MPMPKLAICYVLRLMITTREELATGHVVQSMADKADTEIIIPQNHFENLVCL